MVEGRQDLPFIAEARDRVGATALVHDLDRDLLAVRVVGALSRARSFVPCAGPMSASSGNPADPLADPVGDQLAGAVRGIMSRNDDSAVSACASSDWTSRRTAVSHDAR